jgi:molecular chaperone GrpE
LFLRKKDDKNSQVEEKEAITPEVMPPEEELQEEVDILEEFAEKLKIAEARTMRLQADFDNFRRRSAREKEELSEYAAQKLITQMLPIIDDFERAIEAAETDSQYEESYLAGVELIYRQLINLLTNEGLQEIEALNLPFDPNFHEAVTTCPAPEGVEDNTVTMVLRKGYMLKEKVIRASMVQVAHIIKN